MKTRLETLFVTCLLGWNCLAVHAQVATEAWVQLQGLAVNSPLIARDSGSGLFKLTMGIQKSTNLVDFVPFPMTAPQTSINATGQLEFQFASSNGAAFYRLESKQN